VAWSLCWLSYPAALLSCRILLSLFSCKHPPVSLLCEGRLFKWTNVPNEVCCWRWRSQFLRGTVVRSVFTLRHARVKRAKCDQYRMSSQRVARYRVSRGADL
jgi:hypothetical protein